MIDIGWRSDELRDLSVSELISLPSENVNK